MRSVASTHTHTYALIETGPEVGAATLSGARRLLICHAMFDFIFSHTVSHYDVLEFKTKILIYIHTQTHERSSPAKLIVKSLMQCTMFYPLLIKENHTRAHKHTKHILPQLEEFANNT